MVTGAAAAALDSSGRFTATVVDRAGPPEITASDATTLAAAWAKGFAKYVVPALAKDRGAAIDLASLRPCGTPYYGNTAYQPPLTAPQGVQNQYAAHWFVTLCDDAGAAIDLAVAATAVGLHANGEQITFPRMSGNEFFPRTIRSGDAVPITPERAVAVATRATGRRVTAIPELVLPESHIVPQYARWRLLLDAPVSVTPIGSTVPTPTTELFVGLDPAGTSDEALMIRSPDQPPPVTATYIPVDSLARRDTTRGHARPARVRVQVLLRPGRTTEFRPITVSTTGR